MFFEVINYLDDNNYNDNIYISILKNCLSVVFEYTEELYKPNELNKKNNFIESCEYELEKDIPSRIIKHYFNSLFINTRDSSILKYIIDIYNSENNNETILKLNYVIENYLNENNEKEENIFYSSEKKLKKKLNYYLMFL